MSIFYGAAKMGSVSLPFNTRLNVEEMKQILLDGEPKILFYDSAFIDQVESLREIPSIQKFVCLDSSSTEDFSFAEILDRSSTTEPQLIGGGDNPFLLIYTSGTTGVPKGVILSHKNL